MSHDPRPGLRQRLVDALLTTAPKQRIRLMQAGLATALMAFSAGVLVYAARMGGVPPGLVAAWTVLSLGGFAVSYVAIRVGWSRRLTDPAMTLAQMVFAITVGAAAYAMAGPVRGATFPVLFVILMFGMFRLSPRTMAQVGLYAGGLFGAVMALMAWWRPQAYAPGVERGHLSDSHLPLARGGVERLRQCIEAASLLDSDATLRVTVSAGLTEVIAGESIGDMLARADHALYAAKAEGHNRTVVARNGKGTP